MVRWQDGEMYEAEILRVEKGSDLIFNYQLGGFLFNKFFRQTLIAAVINLSIIGNIIIVT